MSAEDLTTPEQAVRNVLEDLEADVPFSVTHGTVRAPYGRRHGALEAALERMEKS